jgi:Tol biopolymer transport system component
VARYLLIGIAALAGAGLFSSSAYANPVLSLDLTKSVYSKTAGGDLFMKETDDAAGSTEIRLTARDTRGQERIEGWVWSPDGKRIAYGSSWGRIRVVDVEAAARGLPNAISHEIPIGGEFLDAVWTQYPNKIFWHVRHFDGERDHLLLVDLDTRKATPLSDLPQRSLIGSMSSSLDRSKLAYSAGPGDGSGDIFVVDLAKGWNSNITEDPALRCKTPLWSPDGESLAFSVNRNGRTDVLVAKANALGVEPVNLTEHPEGVYAILEHGGWSPDSKKLVFSIYSLIGPNKRELRMIDTENQGEPIVLFPSNRRLELGEAPIVALPSEPVWSSDGRKVAYTILFDGCLRLHVADVYDEEGGVKLQQPSLQSAVHIWDPSVVATSKRWTPDDEQIVFSEMVQGGYVGDVHIVNPNGGKCSLLHQSPKEKFQQTLQGLVDEGRRALNAKSEIGFREVRAKLSVWINPVGMLRCVNKECRDARGAMKAGGDAQAVIAALLHSINNNAALPANSVINNNNAKEEHSDETPQGCFTEQDAEVVAERITNSRCAFPTWYERFRANSALKCLDRERRALEEASSGG